MSFSEFLLLLLLFLLSELSTHKQNQIIDALIYVSREVFKNMNFIFWLHFTGLYEIKVEIHRKNIPLFNSLTGICHLYTREMFSILLKEEH